MSEMERIMLSIAFGGTIGLIVGQTLIAISYLFEKIKYRINRRDK